MKEQKFQNLLVTESNELMVDGEMKVKLAPKEAGILRQLMRKPGSVVSRHEIVRAVWDEKYRPDWDNRKYDVTMTYLRNKLESAGVDRYMIRTVQGVGYMLYVGPHVESLLPHVVYSPDGFRLEIVEVANGYGLYLDDELIYANLGDGVDLYWRAPSGVIHSDSGDVFEDEESLSPGTVAFEIALIEDVADNTDTFLEAYFPWVLNSMADIKRRREED